jgi:G3E family GTPase
VSAGPIPATLLAGFLGSGKTTLLNRMLTARTAERIGVLVNEIGAVGIDGRLVVKTAEEVVQLENGCLCCEVRGDLAEALERMLAGRRLLSRAAQPLARIVIEASGLASPGPIAQTLALDPRVSGRVALERIATLAHAGHVAAQLERHPEAAEQVAYADLLILNHADAPGADVDAAERALRARNAAAPLVRTVHADVALERLCAAADPATGGWRLRDLADVPAAVHTHGVGSVVLRANAPLDLHRLKMWLRFLAARRTHELYRVKGLLACRDHARAVLVQGTYQVLELGPGPEDAPAESVLVLIGKDLDEAEVRRGWAACREA